MSDEQSVRVIKAHARSYDDPIHLNAGEIVRITKKDMWDNQYLWLWCIAASGKEGWVPASFIEYTGEQGIAQHNYSALELTVEVGEILAILNAESGWYWVENKRGEQGWVPLTCCQLLD